MHGTVSASVTLPMKPDEAFDAFVDELPIALESRGLRLEGTSRDARITERGVQVGVIDEWDAGKRMSIRWSPKTWDSGTESRVTIVFAAYGGGTRITFESRGWGEVIGGDGRELLGWFAGEVVAPLFSVSAPSRLGDWITDRHARRPSGASSRGFYENPVYHWPNFLAILDVLSLKRTDNLVEVGCGGGAFLREALKSGCRASAIDHSPDMVRLAERVNHDSLAEGRLKVEVAEAQKLPYPSATFTCAAMTGVLPFLPQPAKTFREVHRVLKKGGRFVLFTGTKELRGTPAAPEPIASRLHFYEDAELEEMARAAGFEAEVRHPSLFEFAKKSGVPKSDLEMFKGTSGSQLLVCRKR